MKKYLLGVATFIAVMLAIPLAAFAHVHVEPGAAVEGTTQTFKITVPNEDSKQKTNKIEISIPQEDGQLLTTVEPTDANGWTSTLEKKELTKPVTVNGKTINEVVTKVTFEGGTLQGKEEGEFSIKLGPMPSSVGKLMLKTIQTYDGGKVSSWIQEQVGSEEPESPVPTIEVVISEKDVAAHEANEDHDGMKMEDSNKAKAKDADKDEKNDSSLLYLVGGVVIVGLLVGGLIFLNKKKPTPTK
ncbi:MAG: YcnI family protein [Acidimicrobiia bacterium]